MNHNLIILWGGICMGMQWYCNGVVILRVRKGMTTNESNIKRQEKKSSTSMRQEKKVEWK